jgi:hypothetical protein
MPSSTSVCSSGSRSMPSAMIVAPIFSEKALRARDISRRM